MDRAFKKIGLSGRAVIPMTLGFGCDTMATIVTRTLETNKERIIATLLLALAIPCSAQLGVIFAILSGNPIALLIWATTIILVFLLIGFLTSKVVTGEPPSFFIELPPIRIPKLKNVLVKTYTRMEWYFIEIFPIFILASVVIWIGQISGAFDLAVMLLSYPVQWIGLPAEASVTFLFGFFRRDYGAAGLFDLHRSGLLSGNSMLVAAVTLTLFLPCIAQLSINIKERGIKTAVAMALFIFPFAFLVGFLLNSLLNLAGIAI
jgi:ferrous iron transport protein B